ASTNENDNTCLSVFGCNYSYMAWDSPNNPLYYLNLGAYWAPYSGSVSVVTDQTFSGSAPTQATPNSICSVAQTFVGKAWNDNGCWVLASNIAAEAGASLPVSSTYIGMAASSGEWIVAYDGASSGNWQSLVKAGEMVVFENGVNSGHITTV